MRPEVVNEPSLEVHRLRVLGAVQAAPMRYLCYRVAMRYLRQGDTKVTARPQDVALLLSQIDQHIRWRASCTPRTPSIAELHEWHAALASAQAREDELRSEVERLRASARSAGEAMGVEAEARADAEWKVVQLTEEVLKSRERAERLEEALRYALNQNEHDMVLTGDEIRAARAALSTNAATQTGETT